jgi:hypothetical protein
LHKFARIGESKSRIYSLELYFFSSWFLTLILAFVSGYSGPRIIIWNPPAPYFHLYVSSCTCALLHNYLFPRQNQGTVILTFIHFLLICSIAFPFLTDRSLQCFLKCRWGSGRHGRMKQRHLSTNTIMVSLSSKLSLMINYQIIICRLQFH